MFQHRRLTVTHLSGEGQRPNSSRVPLRYSEVSSPLSTFSLICCKSDPDSSPCQPPLSSHWQNETAAVKTNLSAFELKKLTLHITETNVVVPKSLNVLSPHSVWVMGQSGPVLTTSLRGRKHLCRLPGSISKSE